MPRADLRRGAGAFACQDAGALPKQPGRAGLAGEGGFPSRTAGKRAETFGFSAILLSSILLGVALVWGGSDSNAWLPVGVAYSLAAATALVWAGHFPLRRAFPLLALPACFALQLLPWPAHSIAPGLTLAHLLRVIVYLTLFVTIRRVAGEGPRWIWLACAAPLIFACAEAVYGIGQHVSAGTDHFAVGTFEEHSHFGGFMAMLLPVSLVFAIHSRALIAWAAPMLMFSAILHSVSRMALAAAAAAIFSMVIIRTRRVRMTLTAAAALLLMTLLLAPRGLADRFEDISTYAGFRHDAALSRWQDTLRLAAARPLLGWGAGTYQIAFAALGASAQNDVAAHANNDYLQLLAETGVVGLGAVLVLFGTALRRSIQAARVSIAALGCAAAIIALLAHSVFEFQMYIPANVLAVCWLAGAGCGAWDFVRWRAGPEFDEWVPVRASVQSLLRRRI